MPDNNEQEKQKHIALEAMKAGQSYIESRKEDFINNMKADLAQKIKDVLKERNMTNIDNILVAAIVLVTGENAESVVTKLNDIHNKLKAQNIDNIILTATFYELDTKYLFGLETNDNTGDKEDEEFPRRLDRVTKIIETTSQNPDGGTDTSIQYVGFGLDWSNVNNWNWPDFIEPLNINFSGDQKIDTLKGQLSIFPKIAYTYCAIRGAAGSSAFDSLCSDLAFPFFDEQLNQVWYTSKFGPRNSSYHYGVDLAADEGLDIHAAADGVVYYAWPDDGDGGGNRTAIQHANNLYTIYMHMTSQMLKPGDQVTKGQVIGHVGNTGHSTGPHLHFQVNVGTTSKDGAQDPARYFERLGAMNLDQNLGEYKD